MGGCPMAKIAHAQPFSDEPCAILVRTASSQVPWGTACDHEGLHVGVGRLAPGGQRRKAKDEKRSELHEARWVVAAPAFVP